MRVGILGGAFDPITKAHTFIAQSVLDAGLVDEIIIMPSFISVFNKEMKSFKDRLEMCSIAHINLPRKYRDRIWIGKMEALNTKGNTLSLYKRLKTVWPHNKFHMIIGMDQAVDIKKWYKWEKLISELPFIVLDRPGIKTEDQWFNKEHHQYLQIDTPDISSTMIREKIKNGETIISDLLDPGVYEIAKKLYT